MKIEPQDRAKVKAECLRLMVSLKLNPAKIQLISRFVDSYLRLSSQEETIFQSELSKMRLEEKEQIMQITTSWEEKGRLEEKLAIALRQLNRKLGSLSEKTIERIKSLESNQLDCLTEDLLDMKSFDDLDRWLNDLQDDRLK